MSAENQTELGIYQGFTTEQLTAMRDESQQLRAVWGAGTVTIIVTGVYCIIDGFRRGDSFELIAGAVSLWVARQAFESMIRSRDILDGVRQELDGRQNIGL